VYERELWKLEKETFEKFDEAETTLHAAIVESLSQGTIRTINTQHAAGISSLYYYCNYHGWNLSHAGPECRVMSNDSSYTQAQNEATSPTDTSPNGNTAIEPVRTDSRNTAIEPVRTDSRKRSFLKSWGHYSN
jgi:hypothetical protein